MTKKIAVVNDLSGFGRCSLTAAISVIAAMGVQPCPVPTAVLSAQTGYPSYFCKDLTDEMELFRREWEKMDVRFDGIYTGFMSGERQIEKAMDFLRAFKRKDTFLLVDPIMGDGGKRFSIFTPQFQARMTELAEQADIITPNLTELCLLADTDGLTAAELTGQGGILPDQEKAAASAEQMARRVMSRGPKEVVVTGLRFSDRQTGKEKMANLTVTEKAAILSSRTFIGESYSGTGDLMASVIAGGKARGDSVEDTVELAGEMIARAIKDSVRDKVQRNEGVEYEKYLWMLTNLSLPE
ncbi:pyridoxamine kinase [Clostridium sp. Marseille-P3244]|uniref:pyridoxamine kinase n=1 Tax=Clostridium sp. Marseille-P3244 TaxID=1871020 RepID=UPI000930C742|nr:pyridoxamine kinase [Clostridium sp. Marseille-P3244]